MLYLIVHLWSEHAEILLWYKDIYKWYNSSFTFGWIINCKVNFKVKCLTSKNELEQNYKQNINLANVVHLKHMKMKEI